MIDLPGLGAVVDLPEGSIVTAAIMVIETIDADGDMTTHLRKSESMSDNHALGMMTGAYDWARRQVLDNWMDDDAP